MAAAALVATDHVRDVRNCSAGTASGQMGAPQPLRLLLDSLPNGPLMQPLEAERGDGRGDYADRPGLCTGRRTRRAGCTSGQVRVC